MSAAIGSVIEFTNSSASGTGIAVTSAMFLPLMRQLRTRSLTREPPQSGQVKVVTILSRMCLKRAPSFVFMMLRYMRGKIPSNFALLGQFDGGFLSRICGEWRKSSSSSGL